MAKVEVNSVCCLFDRHDTNGALTVTSSHTGMACGELASRMK